MSGARPGPAALPHDDAGLAMLLLALDPAGLGGIRLRARPGPLRDRWLAGLRAALPDGAPIVRVPLHVGDERLLGGLDLATTLAAGRPVAERGLLGAADGGVVLLPMAERLAHGTASRIAAALDSGEVVAERDGFSLREPARFGVVALDEGIEPDELPPPALTERLAFQVDLEAGPLVLPKRRHAEEQPAKPGASRSTLDDGGARFETPAARAPQHDAGGWNERLSEARARLPGIAVPDIIVEALCGAALAFGIGSLRAPIRAVAAARASAALHGRDIVETADAEIAARLVLAPRATRLPAEPEAEAPPPAEPPPEHGQDEAENESTDLDRPLDDRVLAAVAAAIPPGLLADLKAGATRQRGAGRSGAGAQQRDRRRGRPAGTQRGEPRRGARLNLVETLRAAAPWQPLRRGTGETRVVVARDDFRITRFRRRTETTTVFVVDASGSSALHRLAEAKGAVELLLAECYVRRDRVAMIAFRGDAAELVLPPTRSLPRAKRGLAALPGGGGTPLATAIDAAATLAETIARAGGTVVLVFLTDGRANIGRGGEPGRERAAEDALAAARRLRETPATLLFVDTAPRPGEPARLVAREMAARYLPLPHGNAAAVSAAVTREAAAARAVGSRARA